jgi:hypothetical protein
MRIGVELNGVLRDTIGKITQVYQKHLIDGHQDYFSGKTYELDMSGNTEENPEYSKFEYGIISEVTTLDLMNHFKFQNRDEMYEFLYEDHTMEIFGHAGSVEISGMIDFNEFYLEMRDKHDIMIISDEAGKSKPASLFFISKFGCLVETVKFYNESTINSMWESIDVLLTANPKLILSNPNDKRIIKYNTKYNTDVESQYSISSIKELTNVIKEIYDTNNG